MNNALAGTESPLKKLEYALQRELAESGNKRDADFKEAFPLIEQYLACKVPQKALLDKFNAAYQHKLHPPGFRKMLDAERKRRAETGEHAACTACGQPLRALEEAAESDCYHVEQ